MLSDKNTASEAKNPLFSIAKSAKNISVDFDGTLISTSRRFYWFFAGSNALLPETPAFIWLEKFFTSLTSGLSKKPLEGSLEALKILKENGAYLNLLTSRRTHLEEITKAWLSKYAFLPLFDVFLFNKGSLHPIEHKIFTLKENPQIEIHIDDSKRAIQELSSALPDRAFIWVNRAYSPKERGINLPNVLEVESWYQLLAS